MTPPAPTLGSPRGVPFYPEFGQGPRCAPLAVKESLDSVPWCSIAGHPLTHRHTLTQFTRTRSRFSVLGSARACSSL